MNYSWHCTLVLAGRIDAVWEGDAWARASERYDRREAT
jgi:hypothetical protein